VCSQADTHGAFYTSVRAGFVEYRRPSAKNSVTNWMSCIVGNVDAVRPCPHPIISSLTRCDLGFSGRDCSLSLQESRARVDMQEMIVSHLDRIMMVTPGNTTIVRRAHGWTTAICCRVVVLHTRGRRWPCFATGNTISVAHRSYPSWICWLHFCATQVPVASAAPQVPLSPETASQAVQILASVVQTDQDHLSDRTIAAARTVVDVVAAAAHRVEDSEASVASVRHPQAYEQEAI
jgi:hypothetical protein